MCTGCLKKAVFSDTSYTAVAESTASVRADILYGINRLKISLLHSAENHLGNAVSFMDIAVSRSPLFS